MAVQATADSPQIVISYHVDDEKWRDRLVTRLDLAAEKFGVLDHCVGPSRKIVEFDDEFMLALSRAKILVLLVSRKYIASAWFNLEGGPSLVDLLSGRHLPVVGVVLQELAMKDLQRLKPLNYSVVNTTPIAEVSIEKQNSVIGQLAREVVRILEHGDVEQPTVLSIDEPAVEQPTIDELARFAKSDEVENLLRRACRLATTSTPPVVTTPALLFGLAEDGRVEAETYRTPQFLWDELTARGDALYTRMLMEEFPALVNLGEHAGRNIDSIPREAKLVSPNVLKVFQLAAEIVQRTAPPISPPARATKRRTLQIEARHLFAALLVLNPEDDPTGAGRRLATIVGDVAALRKRFYNFIVKSLPHDNHQAWRPILINLKLPKIEPATPDQPEPQRKETLPQPTVAGFMADDWTGRDLLGIERDVNAFASLVAAYKVEPPLSIGLFGDWGSGKSHFMRQMRKRVDLLSKRARDSGKPQNELGYYKNIVQIEFNAWHYIEGNLWASLVDHIFANLRLSEDEPRKYADERRDELIQKLVVKEEIQNKINFKVQACENELRKLNERKEQAEAELQQASTQLKGFREEMKASLKTLPVPVTFTEQERELLSRLGIETGSVINAADVRKKYLELKHGWNSVKAKWKLFRSDPRAPRRYVLSALLAIIPVVGAWLVNFKRFPGLPTFIVSGLGFVATLYVAAKPAWRQFQTSLKALEQRDQEVERERQKRITELESEVSALTKEVVAAKLEGETVGKEIQKLKSDINSTNSSKILAEFIEDRAAATDYRRHLGLLALIRRDFEKLRDLFQEQRKEASDGKDVDNNKKIDRIVLYIDDLDRCPPDRVVQVLQAIHLLLAFPLFVVVVGVDSRWITRSLQQSYEWLQGADEIILNNGTEKQEKTSPAPEGATPHDYLEKIFQIPFWLRPMNDDACIEFLDGLTKDTTDKYAPSLDHKQQAGGKEQRPVTVEQVALPTGVTATSVSSVDKSIDVTKNDSKQAAPREVKQSEPVVLQNNEDGPDKFDLAPRSLTFSSYETDYMKKLVPLIGRSPRAVKRFLNCYRLIKVGLAPAEFENFVGENGENQGYKAAMILLGVITGTPTVSAYMIEALKAWHGNESGLEYFVNAFSKNNEMRQQPDAERLVRFLESHDYGESSNLLLQQMVNYAPRVSRFSFRVNRGDASR